VSALEVIGAYHRPNGAPFNVAQANGLGVLRNVDETL
jgi:hypothetical protein